MTGDCHAGIRGSRGLRRPRPPDLFDRRGSATPAGAARPAAAALRSPTARSASRPPAPLFSIANIVSCSDLALGTQYFRVMIRAHAPAATSRRLGSYMPTSVGSTQVLCVKSELHLNQDGVKTGEGTATLPVKDFFQQIITDAQPKIVLTIGTAGSVFEAFELGDVVVTRAAKFLMQDEFRNEPFNGQTYRSDWHRTPLRWPKFQPAQVAQFSPGGDKHRTRADNASSIMPTGSRSCAHAGVAELLRRDRRRGAGRRAPGNRRGARSLRRAGSRRPQARGSRIAKKRRSRRTRASGGAPAIR